jgi:hypothetical protein
LAIENKKRLATHYAGRRSETVLFFFSAFGFGFGFGARMKMKANERKSLISSSFSSCGC